MPRHLSARLRAPFGADDGQSIVELALTLPLIVFALIGGADLARAYAQQLAVQNGARAGAEAAAINQSPTELLATQIAIGEMSLTPGLPTTGPDSPTVSVTFKQANGATDCTNPPTATTPCFVTVRVVYTFRTIIAWPIVPNTATFDRQTIMRTIAAPSP